MSLTYLKNEKGLSRNQKHISKITITTYQEETLTWLKENIQIDRAGANPTTQHYGLEYIKNIKENNNMIDIWISGESTPPPSPPPPKKKEYTCVNNLADFKSRID